ncbi:MAG TPA: dihydrodipicolinate synthase family protein [Chthoniobacteraceae bacterium]|jgi:dihydrodipicolinate synthase/N-acetylneuraminate lyase|nr:dihydrodipicolinate synthase family protein [Chthoniobacteraceae bacterium]
MDTRPITAARLASSVIAVPPLARDAQGKVSREENRKIVRHIEAGGVDILLYGGNANFYHLRPSEYRETLALLAEIAAAGTLVVPSVGPAYGLSMDQAEIAREFDFPTVMVLPHTGIQTYDGVEQGLRDFAKAYGKPIVLYIKAEGYITPAGAARLVAEGLISWIKYAIVRDAPENDPFLSELMQKVDPNLVVSGIGEQPAIVHLDHFKCGGFTSGCVCVNPALSRQMHAAIKSGDLALADKIRGLFRPLEDLRNGINPIRVLHEAVEGAGIAATGKLQPLLSGLTASERSEVAAAATALRAATL